MPTMKSIVDLMNQVPAPTWILLGSLIAAGIAFLGVALTNRSNTVRLQLQLAHELKSKDRDLRRERIEELYVLVDRWATKMVSHMLPYMKVMRGELTYNQALDMTVAHLKDDASNFERIQAIVHLYFPELSTALQGLFDARDKINKIEAQYRIQYKNGELDGTAFLPTMASALNALDERSKALQTKIVEVARCL